MTREGYDISASEWEIMNTIWNKKLISANDVIEIVQKHKEWSPKTIRTLINRLYKKKFIDRTSRNKIFEYFPIVEEKDMKYKTSKVFLDKVYEGGLNSLVLNFVENEELSEDDIEELKNILNEDILNEHPYLKIRDALFGVSSHLNHPLFQNGCKNAKYIIENSINAKIKITINENPPDAKPTCIAKNTQNNCNNINIIPFANVTLITLQTFFHICHLVYLVNRSVLC